MLFNSFFFTLVFLPLVILLHRLAAPRSPRSAQVLLLAASLVFYAWARPSHLALLLLSILFNAGVARLMVAAARPGPRHRWLLLGLGGNLLFLGTLKYSQFAVSSLDQITGMHWQAPHFWFPLGVSFFTIQQVMYLVDCFENLVEPHGLLDHASFVACFPYLVSGPLVRSRQLLRQLQAPRRASPEDFARGLCLFGIGLFKKVVIADCIGHLADAGFARSGSLSGLEAWITCLVYCLQIYFDFSGYSDMAIGGGQMLGLAIPANFNAPYRSTSITEFWQRWHITLSQFITTYLYTPLVRAMGKATLATASLATLAAMAIAGLWHGPAWTYVAFGAIHGVALVLNQVWRKKIRRRIPQAPAWMLTMGVVVAGFVFFRSPSIGAGLAMGRGLLHPGHWSGFGGLKEALQHPDYPGLALALPLALLGPDSNEMSRRMTAGSGTALALALVYLVSLLFLNSNLAHEFLYFAF